METIQPETKPETTETQNQTDVDFIEQIKAEITPAVVEALNETLQPFEARLIAVERFIKQQHGEI